MIRLQEETAKVETALLQGNFTETIVQCFNAPKANSFDYNLLEPLQKLLRLSSPVAASLARPDLLSGIHQKLNHKKAVIRLNLLRVVRSVCEPVLDTGEGIRGHPLFEAIRSLAENDNAVLVRNMASELVKFNLDKEQSPENSGRRMRRQSSFTAPTLQPSVSAPLTPTHASRLSQSSAFMEGSITPRRSAIPINGNNLVQYRPSSREGPPVVRRTSAEYANGSAASKSRHPRTSMLRTSRSSLAAPGLVDDGHVVRREAGVRSKEQPRSPALAGGTAPQLNQRRRTRQPSGDIEWSWNEG